ncbi:MAG: glycosyltransferase family 9 protein [Phycisphaerae bacterium]
MNQRVLAMHSGALGDVVLFGRLLERLEGDITLVAGGNKASLLARLGVAAEAMDFDSLPIDELFNDTPLDDCDLGDLLGPCDRVISCFCQPGSPAALRLATLVGASAAAFLPVRCPDDYQSHLVDLWSDMLGLGPTDLTPPAWSVGQADSLLVEQLLAGKGVGPHPVVIHPGSGGPSKCWPLERFIATALLLRAAGRDVLFVVGPVEQDLWAHDGRLELLEAWPVARCLPLGTLAGLLARASGFLGNDAGPSHLAAAVGAPTLALFGPTDPARFGPLGPRTAVLWEPALEQIAPQRVCDCLMEIITP